MTRSNIPAGYCLNCKNQLFIGQKFCPQCRWQIDVNLLLQTLDDLTLVSEPTPPCIIEHPTEEQINQALNSQKNPYAAWGKLVVSTVGTKKIWTPGNLKRGHKVEYAGEAYVLSSKTDKPLICRITEDNFADFAFQVSLQISDRGLSGVVFRGDKEINRYYYFQVYASSILRRPGFQLGFHENDTEIVLASWRFVDDIEVFGNYLLLGVVAQQNIIDVYADLRHIARIDDYSSRSGALGIALWGRRYQEYPAKITFRRPRVWVKNQD